MGLKALVPGTAAHSQRHHVKFLKRKLRGHDVLLLVEWEDGLMTELAADVRPEMDGWYEATNGLIFANAGEGIDPVQYYGVPVVRCHAQIACPFSAEACLQSDLDEAGEFRYRSQDGKTTQVVQMRPRDRDTSNGDVAADGGVSADNHERVYDLQPPAGSVGWTFSMTQAKQRAPNAISANMIRRAVEYGKESERGTSELLRWMIYGAVGVLLVLGGAYGFQWLLAQIGSGGGGGVVFSALVSAAPVSVRDRCERLVERGRALLSGA